MTAVGVVDLITLACLRVQCTWRGSISFSHAGRDVDGRFESLSCNKYCTSYCRLASTLEVI